MVEGSAEDARQPPGELGPGPSRNPPVSAPRGRGGRGLRVSPGYGFHATARFASPRALFPRIRGPVPWHPGRDVARGFPGGIDARGRAHRPPIHGPERRDPRAVASRGRWRRAPAPGRYGREPHPYGHPRRPLASLHVLTLASRKRPIISDTGDRSRSPAPRARCVRSGPRSGGTVPPPADIPGGAPGTPRGSRRDRGSRRTSSPDTRWPA